MGDDAADGSTKVPAKIVPNPNNVRRRLESEDPHTPGTTPPGTPRDDDLTGRGEREKDFFPPPLCRMKRW